MARFPVSIGEDTSAAIYENIPCIQTYGTSTIKAARKGNVVTLIFGAFNLEMLDWVSVAINPLPEKYRPSESISAYTMTAESNRAMAAINTNGTIELKKGSGSTYWTITYLV